MSARVATVLALVAVALAGAAAAQIGQPLEHAPAALGLDEAAAAGVEVVTEAGVAVELVPRGGGLGSLRGSATLDEEGVFDLARLLAAAGRLDPELERAIANFLRTRAEELAAAGPAEIGVEGDFRLALEVEGASAPYRASFAFGPAEVEPDALPTSRHAVGPADARIVIREFSDFQCPACRRFALDFVPQLDEALVGRGDVRFEYHHFPLQSLHANAFRAAEASECAADAAVAVGDEDGFWRYHDALFETQSVWAPLADPDAHFAGLAEGVGLAAEAVAACLAADTHRPTVTEAYQASLALRLRGTPSLFVNGFPVSDFTDLDVYRQRIAWVEAFATDSDGP